VRRQQRAYAAALLAVLLWSTVASAFKIALRSVGFVQLVLYSSAVSTGALAVLLLARRRFTHALRATRRQYLRSLGLGLLNPLLYYLVLFRSYELLPAQIAQPLNYTWAIALALLSIPLLGQRIGLRDIAAGLVCYSGVWVISIPGAAAGASPAGIVLALGSAFIWAVYWIGNTGDERDPAEALFLNFLLSLPFVLVVALLSSSAGLPDHAGLLASAYVGVVEMGLTFVLWLTALRLSENTAKVGNLIFLSPFVSLLLIRSILGETILPTTVAGLGLIVAGLVYQRLGRRETPDPGA
jgi:drug/metabolite transporter (DMT)-like permease